MPACRPVRTSLSGARLAQSPRYLSDKKLTRVGAGYGMPGDPPMCCATSSRRLRPARSGGWGTMTTERDHSAKASWPRSGAWFAAEARAGIIYRSWLRGGEVIRCPLLGALGLHGDGGLAELCNAPARMCLPVPDSVADEEAALAEPLAVAVRALRRGRLQPGERVAVVGLGAVGLMAVQAAVAFGAESVAVVEPLPERRALAMRLGADRHVPPGDAAALEADVAVECAGSPAAVETAVRAVRAGGRAVVLGIDTRPAKVAPLDLVIGEKSIIGSLSHVWDEDFRIALALLGRGAVLAAPLITDRIPLSAGVTGGLALLRDEPGKHVKILVRPGEPG